MILLTNSDAQTVEPGAAVTFDTVIFQTGNGECHRNGSSGVSLRFKGIYEAFFSANIGGEAAGPVELSLTLDGDALPETVMESVTAAAGDLSNVSTMTAIKGCCEGRVAVSNTGADPVTVEAPKLYVRRIA